VGTISTNKVCPAANAVTAMQIQSGDTIQIKPGCYVWTMDHVISSNKLETIEVAIKTMDWAGKITDLFHYGNKEAIHQAVQGLRTRYNGEFDATILLDQLDQLKTPDTHWAFESPAAMIGAAICLFGLGYCLWRCCCRTSTTAPPQLSAPPMPMPVILPQPASAPRMVQNPVPRNNGNLNNQNAKNNVIPIKIMIT
jgi:hypothetical protein